MWFDEYIEKKLAHFTFVHTHMLYSNKFSMFLCAVA